VLGHADLFDVIVEGLSRPEAPWSWADRSTSDTDVRMEWPTERATGSL
jgi:hypothetical protein